MAFRFRAFVDGFRGSDRFLIKNPSGKAAAELKNIKNMITSSGVRIFVAGTTEANSCCFITGKRIALTTVSPRILLFSSPFASKPWFPPTDQQL